MTRSYARLTATPTTTLEVDRRNTSNDHDDDDCRISVDEKALEATLLYRYYHKIKETYHGDFAFKSKANSALIHPALGLPISGQSPCLDAGSV